MPSLESLQISIKVSFKLTPDVDDKGLRVPKVFLEESFETKLYNKSGAFMTRLVLGSFKANDTTEV